MNEVKKVNQGLKEIGYAIEDSYYNYDEYAYVKGIDLKNESINSNVANQKTGKAIVFDQLSNVLIPTEGTFSDGEEMTDADYALIKARSSKKTIKLERFFTEDELEEMGEATSAFNNQVRMKDVMESKDDGIYDYMRTREDKQ